MKKTLCIVCAAVLILTMSACVNISGDAAEALSQLDLQELYEQYHVDEIMDQMGISGAIGQLIPHEEPSEAPELPKEAVTDPEKMHFKTIGDAMDAADEVLGLGRWNDPRYYVFVFYADGVPYRVVSELSDDLMKTLDDIEWIESNEERNKAEDEFTRPLPVTSEEDLRMYEPSQETVNKWTGLTGKALEEAGFEINGYNNDDDGEYMEITKGLFIYRAAVDRKFDIEEDTYEQFLKMTVKVLRVLRVSSDAIDYTITE